MAEKLGIVKMQQLENINLYTSTAVQQLLLNTKKHWKHGNLSFIYAKYHGHNEIPKEPLIYTQTKLHSLWKRGQLLKENQLIKDQMENVLFGSGLLLVKGMIELFQSKEVDILYKSLRKAHMLQNVKCELYGVIYTVPILHILSCTNTILL